MISLSSCNFFICSGSSRLQVDSICSTFTLASATAFFFAAYRSFSFAFFRCRCNSALLDCGSSLEETIGEVRARAFVEYDTAPGVRVRACVQWEDTVIVELGISYHFTKNKREYCGMIRLTGVTSTYAGHFRRDYKRFHSQSTLSISNIRRCR